MAPAHAGNHPRAYFEWHRDEHDKVQATVSRRHVALGYAAGESVHLQISRAIASRLSERQYPSLLATTTTTK